MAFLVDRDPKDFLLLFSIRHQLRAYSLAWMTLIVLVAGGITSTSLAANESVGEESPRMGLLRERYSEEQDRFVLKLERLAEACEERGTELAAEEVRAWAVPPNPNIIRVRALPTTLREDISPNLPVEERDWRLRLRQTLDDYSLHLFKLSLQVIGEQSPSFAYELLREAIHYNPDNTSVRRLLGFVRYRDEWTTPYELQKQRLGQVDHPIYGWMPRSHVERYEAGQRYYLGRWMEADRESELRQNFRNAWVVESEHFVIKTNCSLERGVEISRALESFHDAFYQIFAGFYDSPAEMKKLFIASKGPRIDSHRYEVHLYRTKEEYVSRLQAKMPQIAITNGLYLPDDRIAYFFHNEENSTDLSTVFHEATHQLMYEAQNIDRQIATRAHFWIVEGIACYMESFELNDGVVSLGNPNHTRFRAARYRMDVTKYYVPLAQFASMGLEGFQAAPNISMNYTQAAGLSHFFMHYDGGRYRDELIEHLSQIYQGDNRRRTPVQNMAVLSGQSYDRLDEQYRAYIKSLGEPVQPDIENSILPNRREQIQSSISDSIR
ncbi:DUF1570 domain-containing protein [Calycomorphotria hydatis]|uniref:DUF1570 domain-containing protein n=1 Tax=Calycomorphotria hydatis TaxID=2528027 RepID=A0A517TCD1_9PLAN|nr:DUF1570 domain-containing protein [Calycomorphotria hydatis]QDT66021.1 hypothetical protein V22_32850 [Calycomorphotria hydatis]